MQYMDGLGRVHHLHSAQILRTRLRNYMEHTVKYTDSLKLIKLSKIRTYLDPFFSENYKSDYTELKYV